MPHALLLSPDDQAVSAISAVLEEMSVSCERPLDGASAAQKLNSRSFDLVLVDCENLPAAKLIFDVCRRGKNGINPVPIAIVDGRAGLPTAFRLGAELILTKPVAKDQARNTIRTAVSRLRKEEPPREVETHEAEVIAAATPTTTEDRALAAAAAGGPVSSQPAQVSVETPAPVEVAPAPAASIAVEEIEATSAAPSPDAVSAVHPSGEMDVFEVSTAEASDDPVLAELERSDVVVPPAIASASYEGAPRKGRNLMVAVVMLALAGGCVYGGWMYQPGLRALLRPFVNRALVFAGVPSSGKAPVPTVPAGLSKPKSLKPATAIAAAPATASPDQAQGHGLNVAADAPARAPATLPGATPSASATTKPESLPESKQTDAVTASSRGLPRDEDTVILSSKGAEKRLVRHVPPAYPREAATLGLEGTVLLKTRVDDSGKVESVELVDGNPALADAAIHAVEQWRYRPYVRDGKSLPFQTMVLVDFQRQ